MGAGGLATQVLTDQAPFPIFWVGPGDEANVKKASLVFWWEEFPVLISLLLPLILKKLLLISFQLSRCPVLMKYTHMHIRI